MVAGVGDKVIGHRAPTSAYLDALGADVWAHHVPVNQEVAAGTDFHAMPAVGHRPDGVVQVTSAHGYKRHGNATRRRGLNGHTTGTRVARSTGTASAGYISNLEAVNRDPIDCV